jgi:hypothetical protein
LARGEFSRFMGDAVNGSLQHASFIGASTMLRRDASYPLIAIGTDRWGTSGE